MDTNWKWKAVSLCLVWNTYRNYAMRILHTSSVDRQETSINSTCCSLPLFSLLWFPFCFKPAAHQSVNLFFPSGSILVVSFKYSSKGWEAALPDAALCPQTGRIVTKPVCSHCSESRQKVIHGWRDQWCQVASKAVTEWQTGPYHKNECYCLE